MAAITGIALKSKLESMMSDYIDKKNTYLKIGKGVSKINQRLKALYNYWVITDQCALTDAEINCIVKDIGVICNTKLVVATDQREAIVPSEPVYSELSSAFGTCDWTLAVKGGSSGSLTLPINVTGGSGGYTYLWTLQAPAGCTAGYDEYVSWTTTQGQTITLSNSTSDTVTVSNIGFKVGFVLQCVVTDSGGNSITLRKQFVDGNASACGFEALGNQCT